MTADRAAFEQAVAARDGRGWVPVTRRVIGDALTPVLAYRRLVAPDRREAPSFLYESVFDGDRVGRYSYLGARPVRELIARGHEVELRDHLDPASGWTKTADDPLGVMSKLTRAMSVAEVDGLPPFSGGWVGYAGYDTVRYLEPEKLAAPPPDDRGLADLHFQLYREVVAFDHAQKTITLITHADALSAADGLPIEGMWQDAQARLDAMLDLLTDPTPDARLHPRAAVDLASPPPALPTSNMGDGGYANAVDSIKQYIAAGDAFQIVPSQRFEIDTPVDPFDVYRALRVVNPSPYLFYLQVSGAMLVGSSPEILCRVDDAPNGAGRRITSRPLAGTRRRGRDATEDAALEAELRGDAKDTAEHVMLVDLHRNDVGRVARPGSIELTEVLTVERYSHVMHLSSEVQGLLRDGVDCWDALRVSLPVGTVSGAPKVRAMQIIDEVEPTRRGPYGGAVGYADLRGRMDMAIALRTMVILPGNAPGARPSWRVFLQAGGGIVHDSDPQAEHQETVNKAAALAKALDVAAAAFGDR
ncbi:MAG: anthranilate synthase component I [Planctomycetota bacterium]